MRGVRGSRLSGPMVCELLMVSDVHTSMCVQGAGVDSGSSLRRQLPVHALRVAIGRFGGLAAARRGPGAALPLCQISREVGKQLSPYFSRTYLASLPLGHTARG